MHSGEALVAREGTRAGARTPAKSFQEPLPWHRDGRSKEVFQTASWWEVDPRRPWRQHRPGRPPAPHSRRAGHVLPGQRDPELACASCHTLWVFGVGLPQLSCGVVTQQVRPLRNLASAAKRFRGPGPAPTGPAPTPAPPPPFFLYPAPRGQQPLRCWPCGV